MLQTADKVKDIERVREDVKKGLVVIMDRYFYSAIAYQSASGFDYGKAKEISDMMDFTKPSIIFFLDIPEDDAFTRKLKQKGTVDRNEKDLKYLKTVRTYYDRMMDDKYSSKWVRIDGTKSVDEIRKIVWAHLKPKLEK